MTQLVDVALLITRRSVIRSIAVLAFGAGIPGRQSLAEPQGEFKGRVVAEWLPDGRTMKLSEPFEYIDPSGKRWPVPARTIVDGASIPNVFWSIIGGPFEGLYRAPSVVHDFYCQTRTRKCPDVHQTFYDAMLTAGVGRRQAWFMYKAVEKFGPQWPDPRLDPRCEVVNEDYDFENCVRNSVAPEAKMPSATKDELLNFSRQISSEVDPADMEKLREAIDKLN